MADAIRCHGLLAELFLAGFGLGDDVVGDVLRTGGVVAELHGELAAAGSHGAEVADAPLLHLLAPQSAFSQPLIWFNVPLRSLPNK